MYDITSEKLEEEKAELKRKDSLDLVESIRKAIEILISLKMEDEQMLNGAENKSISSIQMNLGREINHKLLMIDKEEDGRGYT